MVNDENIMGLSWALNLIRNLEVFPILLLQFLLKGVMAAYRNTYGTSAVIPISQFSPADIDFQKHYFDIFWLRQIMATVVKLTAWIVQINLRAQNVYQLDCQSYTVALDIEVFVHPEGLISTVKIKKIVDI